jgi:hypothetical protein
VTSYPTTEIANARRVVSSSFRSHKQAGGLGA